jgi:hypothetical protein
MSVQAWPETGRQFGMKGMAHLFGRNPRFGEGIWQCGELRTKDFSPFLAFILRVLLMRHKSALYGKSLYSSIEKHDTAYTRGGGRFVASNALNRCRDAIRTPMR